MTATTSQPATKFTRTVSGFAELGALFDIDPETDGPAGYPPDATEYTAQVPQGGNCALDDCLSAADEWADPPEPAPAARLAGLKALGAALDARREQDREGREAALRELAAHDERLATIGGRERERDEASAARAGFEAALARPFGDPDWLYDEALRDDYSRALAEAIAIEAALTDQIAALRCETEERAATPVLARLLAERRRHEEVARAQENAAEANRRRSRAIASAKELRDAGSFEEARRVLGPVTSRFPDDPEARSVIDSIDRAERLVKDAEAGETLAQARRLRRIDPLGATNLLATIDTALLSADRMHELAGVAVDIARYRELENPLFLRGRTPNSLAVVAEERGRWEVAVAVGQDPDLRPGSVISPQLASAARPVRRRR